MSTHEDTEVDAAHPLDAPAATVDPAPDPPPKQSRRERRADRKAEKSSAATEPPASVVLTTPAQTDAAETAEAADPTDADQPTDHTDASSPNWWHSAHPVFTPVAGFFTGLLTLVIVPSIFGAVVGKLFDLDTAQRLSPYVLVIFGFPLVLIAVPKSRRFGLFMLVGMLATLVVIAASAGLTIWYLYSHDG